METDHYEAPDPKSSQTSHLKQGFRYNSGSNTLLQLSSGRKPDGDYTDLVMKVNTAPKMSAEPEFSFHILQHDKSGKISSNESTYVWT